MGRRIGGRGGGSDPGSRAGGRIIAGATLAVAVTATGSGISGGVLGGSSPTGVTADSVAGKSLNARKLEGKKAARKGDASKAWQRMGMRTLKKVAWRNLSCVANSFGEIRAFLAHTPCTSLDRALFGIADGDGDTVRVSVAWVSFRTHADARNFKLLDDIHGTGNVTPLNGAHFTGNHYASRRDGNTTVIAETEPETGEISDDILDAVADVAVLLPRPRIR